MSTAQARKTKACPYCGETIKAVAIKCKHCGSELPVPTAWQSVPPPPVSAPIPSEAVANLLARLVEKSLAVYEEDVHGPGRYRLLETVRQYARDRLVESGEAERACEQHRAFFVALAEEAKPHLRHRDQAAWLHRLEAEHDNFRAALEWRSDEVSLRIVGVLWQLWAVRGHLSEGQLRLASALAGTDAQARTEHRARALTGAGGLAWAQGDYRTAQTVHEEALAIQRELGNERGMAASLGSLGSATYSLGNYPVARVLYHEALGLGQELGDKQCVANSLHGLGSIAWMEGDIPAARTLYNEALAIRRELGDRRGIAYSLYGLGDMARLEGDYGAARALHQEALALQQEIGDRGGSAYSLSGLASVSTLEGDYGAARGLYQEALAIQQELGNRGGIASSLNGFAALANKQGQIRRAARLWGAAEALREAIAFPLPPSERRAYDRQVERARAALGEEAFAAAWAEGRAMAIEQAIAYALEEEA